MHSVVVVGGGFSGPMVALHLTRDFPGLPVAVTVVEPRATLGAGLAYGTDDPACRINVAASRMSPFDEDPGAFDEWLARGGADPRDTAMEARGGRFPARAVYGDYVRSLLAGAPVVHRRAEAVSARRDGAGFAVGLADGTSLAARTLVLALGHPKPGLPRALAPIADDPRLVRDPWDIGALRAIGPDETVMLVGTGLTACDVIAGLRARGHRAPIVAASRRGLLPRQRTSLPVSAHGRFGEAPSRTALALTRRVRRAVREAASVGRPWEDVIAALREQARTVWRALPIDEQRRLLRHARAFWDVHRFQCAPQVGDLVARELTSGGLRVHALSLGDVSAEAGGLRVRAIAGGGVPWELRTQRIVNCTGPGHAGTLSGSVLLGSLGAAGLVRADGLGLGLETGPDNLAIGADGSTTEELFVAGPPARSAHGELMGLPQVSRQPREIATAIGEHVAVLTRMVVAAQTAR